MNTQDPRGDPVLIPDSIEPMRGYKALNIRRDGWLTSPSKDAAWPPQSRLEAKCWNNKQTWGWTPIEGESRTTDGAVFGHNPKPDNPLPEGWSWSWEQLTHIAPAEACQCGIYVVSDPARCLDYIKPEGIVVEVALWGKVIPATNGSRGQYAYPTKLLVPAEIVDEVKLTAALYNVPIETLDEPAPAVEEDPWFPAQSVGQALGTHPFSCGCSLCASVSPAKASATTPPRSITSIDVATPGDAKLLNKLIAEAMAAGITEAEFRHLVNPPKPPRP